MDIPLDNEQEITQMHGVVAEWWPWFVFRGVEGQDDGIGSQ